MDLYELEKSYSGVKPVTLEDERKIELGLIFDLAKLSSLQNKLKSSLEGPLGEVFYNARKDFLGHLIFYLWNKYYNTQMIQIEHVHELILSKEIENEDYNEFKILCDEFETLIIDGLKVY